MHYRFHFRQLPFFILLFIVTYLSLLPGVEIPGPQFSDKIAHFLAYFGTTAAAVFGFRHSKWRLILLMILWGTGIELIQWQMPSRMFDLMDIAANSVGCVVGGQLTQWALTLWERSRG